MPLDDCEKTEPRFTLCLPVTQTKLAEFLSLRDGFLQAILLNEHSGNHKALAEPEPSTRSREFPSHPDFIRPIKLVGIRQSYSYPSSLYPLSCLFNIFKLLTTSAGPCNAWAPLFLPPPYSASLISTANVTLSSEDLLLSNTALENNLSLSYCSHSAQLSLTGAEQLRLMQALLYRADWWLRVEAAGRWSRAGSRGGYDSPGEDDINADDPCNAESLTALSLEGCQRRLANLEVNFFYTAIFTNGRTFTKASGLLKEIESLRWFGHSLL
ncbi:unnamed protein product [Protopolystoma xenopodis]|uniref:Uncharacterized protein n=1 Tax=Protopolystoma xenopodis TaxID=117903 RepID=A0A3S5ATH5_9PLAT|nr:unnamed protein product [Protopolystoma xenopodis]